MYLSKQFADAKESFSKQLRTAKTQIDKLQAKLDEELQWTQDKTMGTNLTQNNYLEDIEDSLVKNAEPFDPVEIVVRVCGFQKMLLLSMSVLVLCAESMVQLHRFRF